MEPHRKDRIVEDIVRAPFEHHRTWADSPLLKERAFARRDAPLDRPGDIPPPEAWRDAVPEVFWDGHPDEVAAWRRAWEICGAKVRAPEPGSGFSRNYVFTKFSGAVFVWGCCFITMFGKYGTGAFPFIRSLENFYGAQDSDGFIPRELDIRNGRSAFERDDPSSVGGDLFAWAEWQWYLLSGDKARLAAVYPHLLAYHRWIRKHRTWKDGTYFCSGWGCGMDNIPRMDTTRYNECFDHGHLSFVDVTFQQILDARMLLRIAEAAGIETGRDELAEEAERLTRLANERMWDEEAGIYKDLDRDGNRVACQHVGAFWALLAGVAPPDRARRLLETLEDPRRFRSACGTASTSMDDPKFDPDGGCYWRGGVWCMMEYMIAEGLAACGLADAAHRLARRHVEAVTEVFRKTGTFWESYSPTALEPGRIWGQLVRNEFVGFSGVAPIALLLEHVLGIRATVDRIDWTVRLPEAHGVRRLRLGDGTLVDLECAARSALSEPPRVVVRSSRPIPVFVNGSPATVSPPA